MKIPKYAIAGLSYCGEWEDSLATESQCREEFTRLQNAIGISGELVQGEQIGPFAVKIWLVVPAKVFKTARAKAEQWMEDELRTTRLLHDAR